MVTSTRLPESAIRPPQAAPMKPPTNHFQKGALLVSRVVCQYLSQVRRSAYSLKHSGKFSSLNRSKMLGSLALAWPMNFGGGAKYSSSRQWTAICDSETSTSCVSCAVFTASAIASYSLLHGNHIALRPPPPALPDYLAHGPHGSTCHAGDDVGSRGVPSHQRRDDPQVSARLDQRVAAGEESEEQQDLRDLEREKNTEDRG